MSMYGYSSDNKEYVIAKISGNGTVKFRRIVRDSTIPEEDIMKAFCETHKDELNKTCGFDAIASISRSPIRRITYDFYTPHEVRAFSLELISETF